jgi:hypothetical protein
MLTFTDRRIVFALGCTFVLFLIGLFSNVLRFMNQSEQIGELRTQIKRIDEGKIRVVVKQDEQLLLRLAAFSNENAMLRQAIAQINVALQSNQNVIAETIRSEIRALQAELKKAGQPTNQLTTVP